MSTLNITIRVNDELSERIEKHRGNKSKADFYREALEAHVSALEAGLSTPEYKSVGSEYIQQLERENESLRKDQAHKDEIIKVKDVSIRDLQLQTGFLISEFQKLTGMYEKSLMPAPVEIKKKKWWEVWKK